jgi:hypothetical protein
MTDWFARPVLHVTDVEASLLPAKLPEMKHNRADAQASIAQLKYADAQ